MTAANDPLAPVGRVLTAMVSPMTDEGEIDHDGLAAMAERLVDDGHDGLVVSGTTGESPTTSNAEKAAMLRTVIDAVGERACIVAGVGTNETRHSIELAREAEAVGADALLVVTPYYNKPPQQGLIAHFTAVADATGLPNVLYDIPGRSGIPIHTVTLQRLAEHDRIVGVKDAKADFFAAAEVMATTNLVYYSGDDALNYQWLVSGAAGVISVVGHVFGPEYVQMIAAVDAGDLAEARRINAALIPAVKVIMNPASQGAIQSKAAAQLLGVIRSRRLRLPLVEATDAELVELREVLIAAGKKVTA